MLMGMAGGRLHGLANVLQCLGPVCRRCVDQPVEPVRVWIDIAVEPPVDAPDADAPEKGHHLIQQLVRESAMFDVTAEVHVGTEKKWTRV